MERYIAQGSRNRVYMTQLLDNGEKIMAVTTWKPGDNWDTIEARLNKTLDKKLAK